MEVVKADPYNGRQINKLECIGPVQKGVGSNLRTLKKECKDKVVINGKQVSVVQKLTHKVINKLQNCYGIAIRQYCDRDVLTLQKAFGAVLYHYSESSDHHDRHQFCPPGGSSWCKYQVDIANNTHQYVEKPGLPAYLHDALLPILNALVLQNYLINIYMEVRKITMKP